MKYTKKSVIVFFVIVIAMSVLVETGVILGGPDWLYFLLMWIPGIAAIVSAALVVAEGKATVKGFAGLLGIRRCSPLYILLAVLIPLTYLLIPYLIYWRINPGSFAYSGVSLTVILRDMLPSLIFGIFLNIITALGEEIGWRGFMLPALAERISLKKTLLVTGLFWACWHLPVLVWGDYMAGAPMWYKVPAFVLCIVPIGIIAGLLTYKSGSVWPAAFLHAAHNNFDQGVFGFVTGGENKMFYVSETGIITIICAWIIALILFKRISNASRDKVSG